MKVWVLTEIWDDGDPGDKASLSKVRVFESLVGVRAAFAAMNVEYKDGLSLAADWDDIAEDFPELEDMDAVHDVCRQAPEQYTWTTGTPSGEGGWDGGYVIEISAVEVEP